MTATGEKPVLPNLHNLQLAEWSVGDDPKARGRIAVVFGTGALTTTFDAPVAPFGVATFAIPIGG